MTKIQNPKRREGKLLKPPMGVDKRR